MVATDLLAENDKKLFCTDNPQLSLMESMYACKNEWLDHYFVFFIVWDV